MQDRFPKIGVDQLTVGMFVADLDRPWLDTPFIVQGVLIEQEEDLAVLRELCQYVYIDPQRSTVSIKFLQKPKAAAGSKLVPPPRPVESRPIIPGQHVIVDMRRDESEAPPPIEAPSRSEVSLNSSRGGELLKGFGAGGRARIIKAPEPRIPSRSASSDLATSVGALRKGAEGRVVGSEAAIRKLADALARLEGRGNGPESIGVDALGPVPASLVPSTITRLVEYEDERPVQAELPRAEAAVEKSEVVLERIVQDIQMGNAVHLEKVQAASNELVDSIVANPDAMMWVSRLRTADKKSYMHGLRVAVYLLALGRHLGYPRSELRILAMIGMLIDVGKLRVPRALLDKRGKLTNAEFQEIQRHVEYGLEILDGTPGVTSEVLEGIAQHHERLNGQGYPHGLRDHQISVYGRMAGLADCFSALVSPRPYAEAMAPSDSLLRLFEWSGEYFHPALVERFVQAIGVFPVGSMVELSSGHVAIVVRHNRLRRLQPRILLLTDSHKQPRDKPLEIDLMRQTRTDGSPIRIARGLPAGTYGLDPEGYYAGSMQVTFATE